MSIILSYPFKKKIKIQVLPILLQICQENLNLNV